MSSTTIVKDQQGNLVSTTTTEGDIDSVEIHTNAKGEYSFVAKVYSQDIISAQNKLEQINEWFKLKFKS